MPRSYRHIKDYEKEIMEMREQGLTGRQIQEKFGFSKKQYENFITRYNNKQRKLAAGIALKKKVTAELQLHSDQGFQYTSHQYFKLTKYRYTIDMVTYKC